MSRCFVSSIKSLSGLWWKSCPGGYKTGVSPSLFCRSNSQCSLTICRHPLHKILTLRSSLGNKYISGSRTLEWYRDINLEEWDIAGSMQKLFSMSSRSLFYSLIGRILEFELSLWCQNRYHTIIFSKDREIDQTIYAIYEFPINSTGNRPWKGLFWMSNSLNSLHWCLFLLFWLKVGFYGLMVNCSRKVMSTYSLNWGKNLSCCTQGSQNLAFVTRCLWWNYRKDASSCVGQSFFLCAYSIFLA